MTMTDKSRARMRFTAELNCTNCGHKFTDSFDIQDPDANAELLREIETVLSSCDEELDAYLSGFPKEDYKTLLFAVDYSHRKIVKLLSKLKIARGEK